MSETLVSADEPVVRQIETNGITMQVAELGKGPLVLLCHGWPESWFSWRRQMGPLAAAGYHVVAPDMRGFGGSDSPDDIEQFSILDHVGDVVGLLDALREHDAVIVGHDWGAAVAWNAALLRPDRFRAVVGVSAPHRPRASKSPLAALRRHADGRFHYVLHFQEPGRAEAELEADPRRVIRSLFSAGAITGDPHLDLRTDLPASATFFDLFDTEHVRTPSWVSEAELDEYAAAYARSGFRGNLAWYRNIDRNWRLLGAMEGCVVTVPAMFVTGERDAFAALVPSSEDDLRRVVTDLRRVVVFEGCGHWVTQERADDLSAALVNFLRELDADS